MQSNNRSKPLLLCLALSLAFAAVWIFLFRDEFGLGPPRNIRDYALRSSSRENSSAATAPSLGDFAEADRFPYGNSAARIKAESVPLAQISDKPFPPFPTTDEQIHSFCSWRTRSTLPSDQGEPSLVSTIGKTAWKRQLKGKGHSTPFVINNRVFLTQIESSKLFAMAIDCQTGKVCWEKEITAGPFAPTHAKGSIASSSPTSNGESIFFAWSSSDTASITALDMSGKLKWQKELGPCQITWGLSSSPLWCCGLVIMSIDNAEHGYTLALDDRSGDTVWCHHRPGNNIEGSYATPAVLSNSLADPLIILPGLGVVQALDARTGRLVWQIEGLGTVSGATPAISPELVIASSGFAERRLFAIRHSGVLSPMSTDRELKSSSRQRAGSKAARETANPKNSLAVVWSKYKESEVPYVPSPLFVGDNLIIVNDAGIVSSLSVDGSNKWRRRLQGGPVTASPILWKGKLVIACESGAVTFLDPETGKVLHELSVESPVYATPTASGAKLYIRDSCSIQTITVGE